MFNRIKVRRPRGSAHMANILFFKKLMNSVSFVWLRIIVYIQDVQIHCKPKHPYISFKDVILTAMWRWQYQHLRCAHRRQFNIISPLPQARIPLTSNLSIFYVGGMIKGSKLFLDKDSIGIILHGESWLINETNIHHSCCIQDWFL